MNAQAIRLSLTYILVALLSACGGGGSDDKPTPAPAPAPTPAPPPTPTPGQVSYHGDTLAAFNLINQERAKAGLQPYKQNTALDVAAAGHANYISFNHDASHFQEPGTAGFTGATAHDRAVAAGYGSGLEANAIRVAEGVSVRYADVGRLDIKPLSAVEAQLNSMYHRVAILHPNLVDIGIASALYTVVDSGYTWAATNSVLNFGTTKRWEQTIDAGFFVYPVDNATNVAQMNYQNSMSEPITPDTKGMPISITTNYGDPILSVDVFTLNCNGQDVTGAIHTIKNDEKVPNSQWAFFVPEKPLPTFATCSAVFQGTSEKLGRFHKTWSFSTGTVVN